MESEILAVVVGGRLYYSRVVCCTLVAVEITSS